MRGGHTLRWVTLRWRCVLEFQLDYNEPNSSKDCDKPQLLVQQQGIFSYLPWLTAALWFITYLVPSGSHSCKDFNTAWQLYLHCIPLHAHFIPLNMCLRLHIESVGSHSGRGFKHARWFQPGFRNCILSYNFCTLKTSVRIRIQLLIFSSNFTPSHLPTQGNSGY